MPLVSFLVKFIGALAFSNVYYAPFSVSITFLVTSTVVHVNIAYEHPSFNSVGRLSYRMVMGPTNMSSSFIFIFSVMNYFNSGSVIVLGRFFSRTSVFCSILYI